MTVKYQIDLLRDALTVLTQLQDHFDNDLATKATHASGCVLSVLNRLRDSTERTANAENSFLVQRGMKDPNE